MKTLGSPAAPTLEPLAANAHHRSLDLVEVTSWSEERLEEAMTSHAGPEPSAIEGWEWNGYNVRFVTRLLGFRKFKKGFVRTAGCDALRGYNVKVVQNGGPLDPWVPQRDRSGQPIHHGFYDVRPPRAPDDHYPRSLLITYAGRNPAWDPSGLLRDYLVALGPDTLLGKAYGAVAGSRVSLGYFVLQRANRV